MVRTPCASFQNKRLCFQKTVLFVFVSLILNNRERSGRVLDLRPRGSGFEPRRRHCVVSLSKNIIPSLVLVQTRKTRPFITERLLMGRKESNQNKQKKTTCTLLLLQVFLDF